MNEYLWPIVIITILILLNGVYVAAEFAVAAAQHTRVAQLAATGSAAAIRILDILRNAPLINRYISTAQIGITIATLGLGMYGEGTIAHWLEEPLHNIPWLRLNEAVLHSVAVVLAVAVTTYLHVVVGEMVPKSLALQAPERSAITLNTVMTISERVFLPLTNVLNWMGDLLLRLSGFPPADPSLRLVSPQELEFILAESSEEGLLDPEEHLFLENILDFQERMVGQVMTPRTRLVGLPISSTRDEVIACICENRYSRYPVYEGDLDHIVGILHTKDLARYIAQEAAPGKETVDAPPFTLESIIRPPAFVPDSLALEQMLSQFRQEHTQLAIVVDEYGGVAGMVTMEDLVEELVGEIQDEYDEERLPIEEISPVQLRVRGDLLLDELEQHYELNLEHDEADTVGGLIMALLGSVAAPGEIVVYNNLTFEVESVDGLAVETVLVRLPATPHTQDNSV